MRFETQFLMIAGGCALAWAASCGGTAIIDGEPDGGGGSGNQGANNQGANNQGANNQGANNQGANNQGANNQGANNQGGSGNQGASSNAGGSSECTPANECEACAANACPGAAIDCCFAAGCRELIGCIFESCGDLSGSEQQLCAATECSMQLAAAGGISGAGTAAAQSLLACLEPALETPPDCPDGPCATCAENTTGHACGG